MYKLDKQEKIIIKEIIKDPRISDNQIAIKTNVPLKTVNRKRKILEEKNLINYYCFLDSSKDGTGTFNAKSLYIISLKDGITRHQVIEKTLKSDRSLKFFPKHIISSEIGEFNGNVALIITIESLKIDDLVEIFNAEIVSELEMLFGKGCIKNTTTIPIATSLRVLRNYLPKKNIEKGKIKESWPDDHIYAEE